MQEHFQVYFITLKLAIKLADCMATSKDLEVQTSFFMHFICNLPISVLLEFVDAVDLNLVFSQCPSLIEAHDLQMR